MDIGAGTGQFAAAFSDWFDIAVVAVEPSAAMRDRIPRHRRSTPREGDATALPLADASADAAWLSLVIHHIPDLEAAAREIHRVLRPQAPVLIRQGFPGDWTGVELVRWFPETARVVDAYPSVADTCDAFAAAGFRREALEPVRETYSTSLADFLGQLDTFRDADTTMRSLTDDQFLRGKDRVRRACGRRTRTRSREAIGSTCWSCAPPRGRLGGTCPRAVEHAPPVGVELVARDETGPNPAGHGSQLSLADQGAHVVLGAVEFQRDVSNR